MYGAISHFNSIKICYVLALKVYSIFSLKNKKYKQFVHLFGQTN